MRTRVHRAIVLLLVSAAAVISSAHALTIDTFAGDVQVATSEVSGVAAGSVADNSAIGGYRNLRVQKKDGVAEVRFQSSYGMLLLLQDPGVTAQAVATWDGNSRTNGINYAGLGGIDLLQDGGSAIVVRVMSADSTAELAIELFDASDPFGERCSSARRTIPASNSEQAVYFSFSALTACGFNGTADLRNIGAIQLLINGDSVGLDVAVKSIVTDGKCPEIPRAGKRIGIDLSADLGILLAALQNQHQFALDSIAAAKANDPAWAHGSHSRAKSHFRQMLSVIKAFEPSILQCSASRACATTRRNEPLIRKYKDRARRLYDLNTRALLIASPVNSTKRAKGIKRARSLNYAQARALRKIPATYSVCP